MANKQNTPDPDTSPASSPEGILVTLSKDDLLELIREARRDPEAEAKIETEAKRVKIRRDEMVAIARQDELSKKARQAACRHRKPNGEETSGGQEFSDGRIRMFCLRCQKVLREYWAPSVAQGLAIAKKMEVLGITEEELNEATAFAGQDEPDDFALKMPRGVHNPSLTT